MSKVTTWFSHIRDKFLNIVNVFRQIKLDDKYYKEYIDGMRRESQKVDSEFAKYDLKISDDNRFITYLVRLPEQFAAATDYMVYEKLNEQTYFITNYLRNTVGFNMYISIPEFYHVEDPTNPDIISMTYLAQWTFQPVIDKEIKHKYLTRLYSVITGVLITGLLLTGYFVLF